MSRYEDDDTLHFGERVSETPLLAPSYLMVVCGICVLAAAVAGSVIGAQGVQLSEGYVHASLPGWIAGGVALCIVFCLLVRRVPMAYRDEVGSLASLPIDLALCAGASLALVYALALTVPALLHRRERQPVDYVTTLIGKQVGGGKGRCFQLLMGGPDEAHATVSVCTSQQTYARLAIGQGMRVRGYESRYGFELDSFWLRPAPAAASAAPAP